MEKIEQVYQAKTSVREFVEFVLSSGDLSSGGFVGSDRALLGTQGHQKVQQSRSKGYVSEVSVSHLIEEEIFTLEIKGRIDGVYTHTDPIIVEEIKTTYYPLEDLESDYNPTHWGQAKVYAYFYAIQKNLEQVEVQLTYLHLLTEQEKSFLELYTFQELKTFFEDHLVSYLHWHRQFYQWQLTRNASIAQMQFPYSQFREGQRTLSVAVYRSILPTEKKKKKTQKLFVQAPTGIGKTMGTLFPAIRAFAEAKVSKIFYLTAKTIGRAVAEKAFEELGQKGLEFKSLTITAKEKICFSPEEGCGEEICELSIGYYDRLKPAIEKIFHEEKHFSRASIERVAREFRICPFEFSLDLSNWVDAIVCDFNYVFDPFVYLRRYFLDQSAKFVFLIDEAHNLVDRARSMFSAEFSKQPVLQLYRSIKKDLPDSAAILKKINDHLLVERKVLENKKEKQRIQEEAPKELSTLLQEFCEVTEAWLVRNSRFQSSFKQELLELYFLAIRFTRTIEGYDDKYVTYLERSGSDLRLKALCLDPSTRLQRGTKRGISSVFFSATMTPLDYFQEILGGEVEKDWTLRLPSPFPREHLCVLVADQVATTYHKREQTYPQVISMIEAAVLQKKGNYLVFFPSYQYMNHVYEEVSEQNPDLRFLCQSSRMDEHEREDFLAQFSESHEETLVGFAIMGGIFGESIDLVGNQLIGAILVGVGLPQINFEGDLIRDFFSKQQKDGFQYAYQYPGMSRVLQTAGRVIRTEQDRGMILLIDQRFVYPDYQSMLPPEWFPLQAVRSKEQVSHYLQEFWKNEG